MAEFSGKVVVVTGAAEGLGLAIANRFAEQGAEVTSEALNVGDPAQSQDLVQRLVQQNGRLDVWVNNAEVVNLGAAESLPLAFWDESIRVMLSGAFYAAQAAGRQMLVQGNGVIVNVASADAFQPSEGHTAYSVAKAGLVALTEALGIEWAKRGVRVVGVAPGGVMTGSMAQEIKSGAATRQIYERRSPMHRIGTEQEIAKAVLFLASDRASYITGETLKVDGGWAAYQLF